MRPAVPPNVESRPADGLDDQSVMSSADADAPSGDGQSAPNLSPQQKRLASKAAYRARRSADDAFREKERERVKAWRLQNRDKTRAQKQKARSANYHRQFVAIDSEGQDYPDHDILYDGVRYPKHETYLWGAAADDGRPAFWLMAAGTHALDKRPLDAIDILDWLLSLPEQFGPAVFAMFSFGYDITQILKAPSLSKRPGKLKNARLFQSNDEIKDQLGALPFFGRQLRNQLYQWKII